MQARSPQKCKMRFSEESYCFLVRKRREEMEKKETVKCCLAIKTKAERRRPDLQ